MVTFPASNCVDWNTRLPEWLILHFTALTMVFSEAKLYSLQHYNPGSYLNTFAFHAAIKGRSLKKVARVFQGVFVLCSPIFSWHFLLPSLPWKQNGRPLSLYYTCNPTFFLVIFLAAVLSGVISTGSVLNLASSCVSQTALAACTECLNRTICPASTAKVVGH